MGAAEVLTVAITAGLRLWLEGDQLQLSGAPANDIAVRAALATMDLAVGARLDGTWRPLLATWPQADRIAWWERYAASLAAGVPWRQAQGQAWLHTAEERQLRGLEVDDAGPLHDRLLYPPAFEEAALAAYIDGNKPLPPMTHTRRVIRAVILDKLRFAGNWTEATAVELAARWRVEKALVIEEARAAVQCHALEYSARDLPADLPADQRSLLAPRTPSWVTRQALMDALYSLDNVHGSRHYEIEALDGADAVMSSDLDPSLKPLLAQAIDTACDRLCMHAHERIIEDISPYAPAYREAVAWLQDRAPNFPAALRLRAERALYIAADRLEEFSARWYPADAVDAPEAPYLPPDVDPGDPAAVDLRS